MFRIRNLSENRRSKHYHSTCHDLPFLIGKIIFFASRDMTVIISPSLRTFRSCRHHQYSWRGSNG